MPVPPAFTTIKLVGVEDLERKPGRADSIRFYGYRTVDMAHRLVCIEVSMREGSEIMSAAARDSDFPEIEISDRHWAYVAGIGKDEARFKKKGGMDGTPD